MRYGVRKTAHIFERVGLALAGAACGLFVGAYVGSSISGLMITMSSYWCVCVTDPPPSD